VRGGAGGETLEFCSPFPTAAHAVFISELRRGVLPWARWQDAERAYQLWKARQVADQPGSGAVAVRGGRGGQEGEEREALVGFVVLRLKGDLFPDFMEYMW
jgi:hypothetical protein